MGDVVVATVTVMHTLGHTHTFKIEFFRGSLKNHGLFASWAAKQSLRVERVKTERVP